MISGTCRETLREQAEAARQVKLAAAIANNLKELGYGG